MNVRKYGRIAIPMKRDYTEELSMNPPKKQKRTGTQVVCRICGYGHVTLHKDSKGMICRDCLEAARKERE